MVKEAFENNVLYHEFQLKGNEGNITLFFISDIHVRKIDKKMIQNISTKVDAVIVGGDLADKRTSINRIYDNLKLLSSLGTTYFVWGNNDREVGEARLREIFAKTGVQVIENNAILLNDHYKIWLSAVDFTSDVGNDVEKTFKIVPKGELNFFISHNPQIFPEIQKRFKVDLLMGGHLHGGQIRLGPFGIHPQGSFSFKNGVPTLISNGYGTTLLPFRFGAKPECHIIDVKFKG